MNYIKEINAFYDLVELEPLPASAVNLWHTLLHMNNKARWAIEFTVSSTVLKLKGGLSESSFQRGRKELVARGLVDWRTRGKNLAPAYRMKRLHLEYGEIVGADLKEERREEQQSGDGVMLKAEGHVVQPVSEVKVPAEGRVEAQVVGQVSQETEGQPSGQAEALIKQKERKRKENKTNVDAVVFYQENFGVASPFVMDDINFWIEDVGELLVIEAMKRALERDKANWGYVKSILGSWVRKGIRTVEAARAERQSMDRVSASSRQVSTGEVVPEWFREDKRRRMMKEEVVHEDGANDGWERLQRYLREQEKVKSKEGVLG